MDVWLNTCNFLYNVTYKVRVRNRAYGNSMSMPSQISYLFMDESIVSGSGLLIFYEHYIHFEKSLFQYEDAVVKKAGTYRYKGYASKSNCITFKIIHIYKW